MITRVIKRLTRALKKGESNEEQLIEEYNRVVEQLEKRSQLEEIGLLTASIEHEIKNPLAVIESEIERMRYRFQAHREVMAGLERIKEQKERIYAITKIIPALRADSSFAQKSMVKTSITSLVHQSISAVKKELNTRNVTFKYNSAASDFFINAYPPLLQQAIINILKNSIEAINESTRPRGLINIKVRTDKEFKNLVRIEINDNGCGIPGENLGRVTTLFTTKSDRKPNAGLGLFITNKIVKTHGGNIGIESKADEGTSVSIILPRKL
jgi:signal transduction histidine kinase